MPVLRASERAKLPVHAFAYVDSRGAKRLPIHDESHVRNALSRFDQVAFESEEARDRARERLLRAAKRYGIVPVGFLGGQIRKERTLGSAATSLPRGTVTFLMSDIERSTRLLQSLGPRYASLLRSVRATLRKIARDRGGHEVDARADEYFAAFADAGGAVDAAMDIQRELAKRRWPAGAAVRVRIGLHRGRTTLSESGYVGIAVHTTARICAAARGGEILISSAMREALGAIPDVALKRVGPVRLEGLKDREVLHRVLM